MKHIKLFENFINENDWITCYHRSDNLEHLEDANFSLDYGDDEESIFGKALYFASSSDISSQLGKYLCKYKIKLIKPLDLNIELSNEEANGLLATFLDKYKLNIYYYNKELGESVDVYDFNDEYNGVQFGEFFLQLSDIISMSENPQIHYYDFIKNFLGYNSFYHYSDFGTNFRTDKGDYGLCYGLLYDDSDKILFVDGPF